MELFRGVLQWLCVAGLLSSLALLILAFASKYLVQAKEWIGRNRLDALFVVPFVIFFVYVGATKVTGRVEFPYTDVEQRYIFDYGSYVTNDYAHIAFTVSPIVPSSADLMIAVRPSGDTNDLHWVIAYVGTFASFNQPQDFAYPGAETNVFQVFTTYTPGPAVHTNGVAVINWQRAYEGATTNNIAPIRTSILENGVRIAPTPAITNGPPLSLTITATLENEGENND